MARAGARPRDTQATIRGCAVTTIPAGRLGRVFAGIADTLVDGCDLVEFSRWSRGTPRT